jgi:hypothetical protein
MDPTDVGSEERTTEPDHFELPEVLVSDQTLSPAQKRARLEAWEEDLEAWLRVSDKSITRVNRGLSGALLRRVTACLEQLRSIGKPEGKPTA